MLHRIISTKRPLHFKFGTIKKIQKQKKTRRELNFKIRPTFEGRRKSDIRSKGEKKIELIM